MRRDRMSVVESIVEMTILIGISSDPLDDIFAIDVVVVIISLGHTGWNKNEFWDIFFKYEFQFKLSGNFFDKLGAMLIK